MDCQQSILSQFRDLHFPKIHDGKIRIAKWCLLNAFLASSAKKHLTKCKNAQNAFFTECKDDIFVTVIWEVQLHPLCLRGEKT
jgi:hypothetical protein